MKKLIRAVMGGGVVCLGLGTWSGMASASPAVHSPAQYIPPIFPAEGVTPDGALPMSATIVGNCPSYLFGTPTGTNATDAVGFAFSTGNAHAYRLTTPGDPSTAQGENIEGIATLIVGDSPDPFVSPYSGQAHLWFGTNSNANGHSYFGMTISFHGVTPDGSQSITITANPGSNTSVTQNQNNWGHAKITCT